MTREKAQTVNEPNFLLVGVGGQGTILASNILADLGLASGYEVKKSEVHGMAQRGGSVTSHIRWGRQVFSPIIGAGEEDVLLAFEKLEALRYAEFLRPGGLALVAEHAIPPVAVSVGNDTYPEDGRLQRVLDEVQAQVCSVPTMAIARELGNARAHNLVMLGALSRWLEAPMETWAEVIARWVPARHLELNQRAFQRGRALDL
ncbi:MAG: indolepyruvate oxidoreductase subunit beta [Chloroflexi bacterium]|nr:indolepyruvate oxidoreductase subunit beta [Chloroflexota bacterium]